MHRSSPGRAHPHPPLPPSSYPPPPSPPKQPQTPEFQCHHADCLRRFMRKTSLTNHLKAHNNHRSRSIYRTKRARMRAAAAMQAVAAHAASDSTLAVHKPALSPSASSGALPPRSSPALPPRPPSQSATAAAATSGGAALPGIVHAQSHSSPVSTAELPCPPCPPHFPLLHPSLHPSSAPSHGPAVAVTSSTTNTAHHHQQQPQQQVSQGQYAPSVLSERNRYDHHSIPATLQHLLQPITNPVHVGEKHQEEVTFSPSGAWPPLPSPTNGADIAMSFLSPRSFGHDVSGPNFTSIDMMFGSDSAMLTTSSSAHLSLPSSSPTMPGLPPWSVSPNNASASAYAEASFLMMDLPMREPNNTPHSSANDSHPASPGAEISTHEAANDTASADDTSTPAGTPITPADNGNHSINASGKEEPTVYSSANDSVADEKDCKSTSHHSSRDCDPEPENDVEKKNSVKKEENQLVDTKTASSDTAKQKSGGGGITGGNGSGSGSEYLDVELLASYELLPDLTLD